MSKRFPFILLAVFLILAGLSAFGLSFSYLNYLTGAVALVAGVLFLFHK